jgi:hypothetical protein
MPELAPNGDDYGASFLTNSSGSLAIFAAIRRTSSRVTVAYSTAAMVTGVTAWVVIQSY